MDLEFTWINLLILFGALQGLIFGIILIVNKKHPGVKFLAVFMFILSYNGFETFSWSSGLDQYSIFFDLFGFVFIYGLGPSLFLYVHSLLCPNHKLSLLKIIICFSPLIFQLLMKITLFSVYFYSVNNENADKPLTFLNDLVAFYNWYSEPMSVIIFLFFLVLSIRLFVHLKKNKSLKAYSKSSVDIISKWVKALLICMTILGALWPLILISPYFLDTVYDVHYYPIEILLVFFIYWVAFVGYHKIKVIYPSESKVIVSGDEAYRHLTTLCKAMNDDKLYLDPELNREKVAAHLHLSPKVISSVLNQYANQNFNDFVNSYRVNEVVDRLESGKVNHLTLSGIALDSGFNSQATFQRVFKSVKGMSPKEFQSLVEQKVKN